MIRVGLTGGIGCGKSTVAAMMTKLGCHVIDADRIAHESLEPGGPGYEEIVHEFGREILAPDGRVDRARLAGVVFANPQRLAKLNSILHPRVLSRIQGELARIEQADSQSVAVVEAALLIESGYHQWLDRLVLLSCTPKQQIERLTIPRFGRKMSLEDAQRRIAAQMTLKEKRKVAHDEIDCSGTLEHTQEQVVALVGELRKSAARQIP
jgi:dephospho-CoA kinase